MRVLFVGNLPKTRLHAVPRIMLCIGDELVRTGHQVDYVFAPDVSLRGVPEAIRPMAFSLSAAPILLRADRSGYDIIAAHSGSGWAYGALRRGVPGGRAKLVQMAQGWEDLYWARYMAAVRQGKARVSRRHKLRYRLVNLSQTRMALRLADHLICCSDDEREHVLRQYPVSPSRISVVPNGVSQEYFYLREHEPADAPPSALFVGQWSWAKGPDVLSSVCDRLLAVRSDMRISLVGTRKPASVVLEAFSPRTRQVIQVAPEVDESSLQREYRSHAILMLPSRSEGMALTALEAMASSMAVVTTDVGGMKSAITSGVTGFIVPSGDADTLYSAVERLVENADLRRAVGSAAQEAARAYTWDRIAQRMLGVFRSVLSEPEHPTTVIEKP